MPIIEPGEDNGLMVPLRFSMTDREMNDCVCRLVFTYRDAKGFQHVHQEKIDLPLDSLYKLRSPVKESSELLDDPSHHMICLRV